MTCFLLFPAIDSTVCPPCIPGHTHEHGKSISLPLIILRGPPEQLKELIPSCCAHDVLTFLARAIQASSRDPSRLQLCHFTTHGFRSRRLADLCQRTIILLALYSRPRAVAFVTLLGGRQIVYLIYEYFRVTGANDSVENCADLCTIKLFFEMIFRNSTQSGTECYYQ